MRHPILQGTERGSNVPGPHGHSGDPAARSLEAGLSAPRLHPHSEVTCPLLQGCLLAHSPLPSVVSTQSQVLLSQLQLNRIPPRSGPARPPLPQHKTRSVASGLPDQAGLPLGSSFLTPFPVVLPQGLRTCCSRSFSTRQVSLRSLLQGHLVRLFPVTALRWHLCHVRFLCPDALLGSAAPQLASGVLGRSCLSFVLLVRTTKRKYITCVFSVPGTEWACAEKL